MLLSFAGLLSNSRAFGIALILFALCLLSKLSLWKSIILLILALVLYSLILIIADSGSPKIFYLARNFDFSNWAAANVYFSSLKNNSFFEWIFGKGYGLEGWNAVGGAISFDYSSTESYIISIISQMGLIAAFIYTLWIFSLIKKNSKNRIFVFMLIYIFLDSCFTPAFCGYAFSYVAWFAIVYISKFCRPMIHKKE